MLAVVKKLRTKQKMFEVRGAIPRDVVTYFKKRFGEAVTVVQDDEDYVDITQTAWYKKRQAQATPGKTVQVYRQRDHWTQAELGQRLGGLSIQKVSDIENDRRGISKELAKKLALIFNTSTDKFL